jgi:hypothetical protein
MLILPMAILSNFLLWGVMDRGKQSRKRGIESKKAVAGKSEIVTLAL